MPLKIKSTKHIDIEYAVLYWIKLLSEEKYEDAYNLTLHDPYYQWTPALLESVIKGYGFLDDAIEEKYKVTPTATAVHEGDNHKIYKDIRLFDSPVKQSQHHIDVNIIGEVHYDLPLNGRWSDLTASFKILQESDFLMLELNDIHVL